LVRHEQMAGKFRLQNQFKLVDICFGRFVGAGNRVVDGELAELEGGDEESGRSIKIRVVS